MNISITRVRQVVGIAGGALLVAGLTAVAQPASADSRPADPSLPSTPRTFAADALPTVQVNGVVWDQEIVGNTVYVGGEFSFARPAGASPNTNQVARSNLLAYDIRTGEMLSSWAPTANAPVETVTASPDGSRIYVGGSFTAINGQTARRIAALNPTTGARIASFAPSPSAKVQAIVATNDTVYYGGGFGVVNGVSRAFLAANRASDGALLNWAPSASDNVRAMAMSPDGTQVLIGGEFQSLNGSSNPGYGLGSVDAVTGALLPWESNNILRNAINGSAGGAILSLSQGSNNTVHITGYTYGRAGGTLEGTAKASWDGGKLVWLEDCHGDTYDTVQVDSAVYAVSHAHYCGNVPGGFGQNQNWNWRRGMAFSDATTQTLRRDPWGYTNFEGNPAPSILQWFPRLDAGTFTGQSQAAYTSEANDDYIVLGGEFPRVNGTGQQGLVRFARSTIAPNNERAVDPPASFTPTLRAAGDGQVLVSWRTNWDRDNGNLTYRVVRNGNTANPILTRTVTSSEWNRPYMGFLDTQAPAGSTATYRVDITDPWGNERRSNTVSIAVPSSGAIQPYARAVGEDGPQYYWRFSEPSGTNVSDYTAHEDGTLTGSVTRGVAGAITGDSATRFPGSSSAIMANTTSEDGPFWYSVEGWFRTTSNQGGTIVSFGNRQSGSSTIVDRALYLDSSGRVNFGSRMASTRRTLTSAGGLNNGQWHHAVGVQSDAGMRLYVDGVQVGSRGDIWTGASDIGWWRVGGDNLSGWANDPSSDYLDGDIDEVAVYTHPLSGNAVREHYTASGRTLAGAPADTYGSAVYGDGPDAYWRLAETNGSTANDSSFNGNTAAYLNNPSQGSGSAIGLGTDRSVTLDGSNDNVALNTAVTAPTAYSEEAWFRTSTNSGGRILGFGNARTGSSTTADRSVFMTNSGKVRFATSFRGAQYALESPSTYNDNAWHHVVATQDANGMRLFLDGVQVGDNTQGASTVYSGFWRIGGDSLLGVASRPSSDYFAGQVDEVAVYPAALSATRVAAHYAAGGGTVPNQPPVAAFTVTKDNLAVQFDSSGSSDADGTIVSREWSFGDGGTSTLANPQHTYASAGTYTVSLKVTDNDGGTNTVSQQVSVSEPVNQAPVAAFTTERNQLAVSVDGSGSDDPDGSIASYAWSWGDGTAPGSGVTASHTYAQAGTYTITLTVTDNKGLTDTETQTVQVSTAPVVVAEDAFSRTTTGGWGSADTGGAWTVTGATSRWNVSGGLGQFVAPTAGSTGYARLNAVSAQDVNGVVDLSVDKLSGGGGTYSGMMLREATGLDYRAIVRFRDDGLVNLYIGRLSGGSETKLGPGSIAVPGLNWSVGDTLRLRFSAVGNGTTDLRAKLWKVGTAEPASWTISTSDATPALQAPGRVTLYGYASGSTTNLPLASRYDNLQVELAN